MMPAAQEPPGIRLADILVAASCLANFRLDPTIRVEHLQRALAVVLGEAQLESFGTGVSPLVPRRGPPAPDDAVRNFAQRWSERLGGPLVPISDVLLTELRTELETLTA